MNLQKYTNERLRLACSRWLGENIRNTHVAEGAYDIQNRQTTPLRIDVRWLQHEMERDVHLSQLEGVPTMEMTVADSKSAPEIAINSQEKEIQELTEVFIRCLPSIYVQALRRLGNVADAEDAVQDAYLSAYTHLNQFRRQAQRSTCL